MFPYSSDTSNYYEYFLSAYLGNTRVAFGTPHDTLKVEQQDDYLPFGMEISQGTAANPKNEYLYNKKELQEDSQLYDYGARFYDPVVGRFTTIDPLAELSRRFSPYNFVENDPIRNTDPDGMEVVYSGDNVTYTGEDAINFATGIKLAGDKTKEQKDKDRAKARAEAAERKKQQDEQQKRINEALLRSIKAFASIAPVYAEPITGDNEEGPISYAKEFDKVKTITWEEFDKIAALEDAGTVVLGKFPEYLEVADKLKATVFNLPNANMLSDSEMWNLNKQFLDQEISKGSQFVLAKPVMSINQQTGFFRKELDYLLSKGYRLNGNGGKMVR